MFVFGLAPHSSVFFPGSGVLFLFSSVFSATLLIAFFSSKAVPLLAVFAVERRMGRGAVLMREDKGIIWKQLFLFSLFPLSV